jgi:membrane-associated phospholipid phosphatase
MTTTTHQKEIMEKHESEWVYSTTLSRPLHDANRYIHGIESLPHPLEFAVFFCGYAFNPVMIPVWASIVYWLTRTRRSLFATVFYLCTVLVTLLATETCKALFSATRPEQILGDEFRASRLRRYRTQVSSLKSKHSFPSGDCAQATNLCFFLYHYLTPSLLNDNGRIWVIWAAFGMFLPGVCFARVFYHCHWIEDCIGGIVLSSLLHWLILPNVEAVYWRD